MPQPRAPLSALMLNPNSAHAWNAKGYISARQNRPDPAIKAFHRAMRLSPLDPLGSMFSGGLAFAHFIAGRHEQALEWTNRCLREQPRFASALRIRVAASAYLGDMDEAAPLPDATDRVPTRVDDSFVQDFYEKSRLILRSSVCAWKVCAGPDYRRVRQRANPPGPSPMPAPH